uniref:Synaptopodin-2-like n=1 Tax=Gouania willdenowi TaxID=441366 RepID=A0A8C5ENE0_GOUWI
MDPMAEDLENNDTLPTWSGSEGSQDLDVSESYTEYDVIESPEVIDSDPETTDQQDSVDERLKYFESNEGVSYQEEDDSYLSDSRVSTTDTPLIETSQTSQSSHPECPESVPNVDHGSKTHSKSSSSSLEYTADMTLALTLTAEAPQGACNRQDLGTGNRRAESSEEGGSSEVPPASVFFGASNECAEQAETWYLESDTDLYRPDKHRTRYTRRSHNDSQSEKQVKETKSKCKRIARLLTEAPNPLNKGAILFKKRQQRVKKYTLVSYGTGDDTFDDEEKIEEETEQVRSSGYTFVSTSDSEVEEQYSLYHQQHSLSLNWERLQEMDSLPNAKGKGVLMFSQRRKRIDELQSEHEDMRRQGLACEAECTEGEDIYDINERYVCADKTNNMDAKLLLEYKGSIQEMNHASDISKGLVPNRTAKPFMGFQDSRAAPYMSGTISTVTKKPGAKLKVPVPIITNPQVWSPTGDIIASRDERISVPAIRTGILPESKRKPTNKQTKQININQQNKGDRCSYIEPEEDCFSLGAEACNFMQPRTVKLKNPPPVAPKPTINPACPPWMRRSPSCEQYIPPRSPVSQPTHSPVGPHSQPSPARNWSESAPNSIVSCPPGSGTVHPSSKVAAVVSKRKGAQLFAKRQSRMQKFVIDGESAQASKTRSPSPTSSLPNSWRYSPNVRAPPPLSYNPLLGPFYPPRAGKQPLSTSPKIKPKPKEIPTPAPKQLNTLDIMKHQPYHLNSSLFKYSETPEAKSPSPKPSPRLKFESEASAKAAGPVSPQNVLAPNMRLAQTLAADKPIGAKLDATHAASDLRNKQPTFSDSIASAFSPASLIARGVRQMAPRPKFSAKKPVVTNKQKKLSRSLSLPRRLNSMPSPRPQRPVMTPTQRQTSCQEKAFKPLTPWEAASRSPLGSVDEAFMFQSLTSSVASNVKAAGLLMSLPQPPDEWKRRVSLDPASVSRGQHHHTAPAFQQQSMSRVLPPKKPAFCGPPFRPAQPLKSISRTSIRFMTPDPRSSKYLPAYGACSRSLLH